MKVVVYVVVSVCFHCFVLFCVVVSLCVVVCLLFMCVCLLLLCFDEFCYMNILLRVACVGCCFWCVLCCCLSVCFVFVCVLFGPFLFSVLSIVCCCVVFCICYCCGCLVLFVVGETEVYIGVFMF